MENLQTCFGRRGARVVVTPPMITAAQYIAPTCLSAATQARWISSLEQAGLVSDGQVRPLGTPEEGIAFIDSVTGVLPPSLDLLDAFRSLDFGAWCPDGRKDINASLRSLGMFEERWKGNRLDALWHPIPSRASAVQEYERLLDEEILCAAGLTLRFPGARLAAMRLQVECHALAVYMDRSDWLNRLWPDDNLDALLERAHRLVRESRPFDESARNVFRRLPTPVLE